MCRVNDKTERPMTRSLAAALGALMLAATMGTAEAQSKSAAQPELASVPSPGAFESLSPGNSRKAMVFDGHHSESFRVGLGPYVGYRVDSYSKSVIKYDGEKHKDHSHQNFYLDNLRYGLRLQIGFRDADVFINYDLNELYTAGKGPKLNAFSFGITL